MTSAGLHRFAVFTAIVTLIVIALGALLTSYITPLPGPGAAAIAADPGLEQAHRFAGYALALLLLILVGLSARMSMPLAGGVALLGLAAIFSNNLPILHALAAPVLFSLVVAIAVTSSNGWQRAPQPVENQWGPLRPLGLAVPVLVFMQIGLGAAFRHNAMGVISHILNAMLVLAVILIAGIFVLREYPEHPSLRPAALTLVIVTGVQVLLGFSVYLILLMSSENNMGLVVTAVLHVINGSLTLASGVVLAMQVDRNLAVSNRSVTSG